MNITTPWNKRQRLPIVFQSETTECALACLTMVAQYYSRAAELVTLREKFSVSLKGLTLKHLVQIGKKLGLSGIAVNLDIDDLKRVSRPLLLHWDSNHYVVLKKVTGENFIIHDPARGVRIVNRVEMDERFTGVAVLFEPDEEIPEEFLKKAKKASLTDWVGSVKEFKPSFVKIFFAALTLEMLFFLQPLFFRSILDVGIGSGDPQFIYDVGFILLLLAVIAGTVSFLRDKLVYSVGSQLSQKIVQRLFDKALSLPITYFEKRPIGHLIERFKVTDELERYLVSSIPLVFLDSFVSLAALAFLFYVAPPLGFVGLAFIVSLTGIKLFARRHMLDKEQDYLYAKGEESGYLIESFKSIYTIKNNSLEKNRIGSWKNRYHKMRCKQRELGIMKSYVDSVKVILIGVTLGFLIIFSSLQVISGAMTSGLLVAVLFYGGNFLVRTSLMMERLFEFQVLFTRLARLEDIIFNKKEQEMQTGQQTINIELASKSPLIKLSNLAFSYSEWEFETIKNANFEIQRGEFIALVGPNGAGKTTLMKLLLGLYRPTSGSIYINGKNLNDYDLLSYREVISCVNQDDALLSGSLLENITGFKQDPNLQLVNECLEIACLKEDVEQLPMGLDTRVGDLGSPLSEGQKQKLFLARALYRQPQILIMDEGTANLDMKNEHKILNALKNNCMTKIFIAHREATLMYADRVLCLADGEIEELSINKVVNGVG